MGRSSLRQLMAELKRRRVYRVAAVYVVVAWALLQLGNIVVEPLRLPEWTMPLLIVLLLLGFPVAMVLAWAFDVTPEGVRRTEPLADPPPGRPSRSLALAGLGVVVLVGLGAFTFLGGPSPAAEEAEGDAASEPALQPDPNEAALSVAVLPFANASPDPENAFFADGVMEDILTHLSLVPGFSVISRTTAMQFRDSPLSTPDIAEELGVRYVLAGSVRRSGPDVRITTQLVDGRTDQNLWADTYDRRLEDIFTVQTEIAAAVAEALEAELSHGVAARIERRPTDDLEAYDLFLQGREQFHLYTAPATEAAITMFRRALERDPEFALARGWMARAMAIHHYNHAAGDHWADSAVAHARRAISEDPEEAMGHTALAGLS